MALAADLPGPAALLAHLTAVSLVEAVCEPDWQVVRYQLHPLVAARYQRYLFEQERRTLDLAIITHAALRRAGQKDEADHPALDFIVGRLSLHGFFRTLLTDWLPDICQSENKQTRATALGQTGKQHLHIGDYDTALQFLQQSLAICQEIGDVAGLCATLFNMGHIHRQNNEQQEALMAWVTVYQLASQMNLAQALQALERLAGQIGLPGGLRGWAALAQRMEAGSGGE